MESKQFMSEESPALCCHPYVTFLYHVLMEIIEEQDKHKLQETKGLLACNSISCNYRSLWMVWKG